MWILVSLVSLSQFGMMLPAPSIAGISHHFSVDVGAGGSIITAYVAGVCSSQLVYGYISDRFGRKPAVTLGLSIFLAGSILVVCGNTMGLVLGGRLLQGGGMGCATTVARAVLRDTCLEGGAYTVANARLASALSIAPIAGPVLGGYLESALGWRAGFIFMLAMGVVMAAIWLMSFRETRKLDVPASTQKHSILVNCGAIVGSSRFWTATVSGGLIYAGEVVFLANSPHIALGDIGLPSEVYGLLLMTIIIGYLLGARVTSRVSRRYANDRILLIGLSGCALAGVLMGAMGARWPNSSAALFLPMGLYMVGAGAVYPCAAASAIGPFATRAGTASAVFSTTQGVMVVLIGVLSSTANVISTVSALGAALTVLGATAWLLFFRSAGPIERPSTQG
ncbi:MFS transporter [Pandoraea sp. PE-S2T-3]|uniref:MFS transporter n=1 Tax=Pandoraea sp. PE-S2T-3 TaxID=1986993 RepID=UPI000B403E88|nr:MFS transporter [Pandoraea sp. PE-S2T-3]